MIRRLLNNIEIKIICLLLSVVMWLYANDRTDILSRTREFISGTESGAVMLRDVPIDVTGIKEANDFSTEPSRVSIFVICSKNAIIDMTTLRAKVKWQQKDNKKVSLDENNIILPEGLKFIRSEPNEIRINAVSSSG